MVGDPNLPALPEPEPADPAPRSTSRPNLVTCQFCDNELAPNGDVFRGLSARAKRYNRQEQEIEQLRAQLVEAESASSDLTAKLGAAQAELSQLKASPEPAARAKFWNR